jgi:hypothetical protein
VKFLSSLSVGGQRLLMQLVVRQRGTIYLLRKDKTIVFFELNRSRLLVQCNRTSVEQ